MEGEDGVERDLCPRLDPSVPRLGHHLQLAHA